MLNYQDIKEVPVVEFSREPLAGQREILKAPIWCSVDLRDSNQALVE